MALARTIRAVWGERACIHCLFLKCLPATGEVAGKLQMLDRRSQENRGDENICSAKSTANFVSCSVHVEIEEGAARVKAPRHRRLQQDVLSHGDHFRLARRWQDAVKHCRKSAAGLSGLA